MVQWLRICLPQGTWVWSLVQEDSACRGAVMPTCHNCQRLQALEPMLCNKRGHCSEKPTHCKQSSSCLLQQEKDHTWQQRPTAAINKIFKKEKKCLKVPPNKPPESLTTVPHCSISFLPYLCSFDSSAWKVFPHLSTWLTHSYFWRFM